MANQTIQFTSLAHKLPLRVTTPKASVFVARSGGLYIVSVTRNGSRVEVGTYESRDVALYHARRAAEG